jgi:hypothetical protein
LTDDPACDSFPSWWILSDSLIPKRQLTSSYPSRLYFQRPAGQARESEQRMAELKNGLKMDRLSGHWPW